ncbi:hypothetical protein AVEN_53260-1 [Araneus ventricosus]|uniref:Uncharacterized protein n=1 Tax=Araneus ventricosus TaxID=182803 RepID=A0A4Y2ABC5_ARAVE|nr:hypothetical protein AVEN_53260-1 [Araneus ventricosus]
MAADESMSLDGCKAGHSRLWAKTCCQCENATRIGIDICRRKFGYSTCLEIQALHLDYKAINTEMIPVYTNGEGGGSLALEEIKAEEDLRFESDRRSSSLRELSSIIYNVRRTINGLRWILTRIFLLLLITLQTSRYVLPSFGLGFHVDCYSVKTSSVSYIIKILWTRKFTIRCSKRPHICAIKSSFTRNLKPCSRRRRKQLYSSRLIDSISGCKSPIKSEKSL